MKSTRSRHGTRNLCRSPRSPADAAAASAPCTGRLPGSRVNNTTATIQPRRFRRVAVAGNVVEGRLRASPIAGRSRSGQARSALAALEGRRSAKAGCRPQTQETPAPPFLALSKPPQRHSRSSPSLLPGRLDQALGRGPAPPGCGFRRQPRWGGRHRLWMLDIIGWASISGRLGPGSRERASAAAAASRGDQKTRPT